TSVTIAVGSRVSMPAGPAVGQTSTHFPQRVQRSRMSLILTSSAATKASARSVICPPSYTAMADGDFCSAWSFRRIKAEYSRTQGGGNFPKLCFLLRSDLDFLVVQSYLRHRFGIQTTSFYIFIICCRGVYGFYD